MPYTREERTDREAFQEFQSALPYTMGITVVVCPKCGKTLKEYPSKITGLNKWAFKERVAITMDGRGCECFK